MDSITLLNKLLFFAYNEEALNKEIIEDVDKVFTTMKEDSLSDSDLDFIDDKNTIVVKNKTDLGNVLDLSNFHFKHID